MVLRILRHDLPSKPRGSLRGGKKLKFPYRTDDQTLSVPKSRACEASGQRGLKKKFWKPSPHFSLDLRKRGYS